MKTYLACLLLVGSIEMLMPLRAVVAALQTSSNAAKISLPAVSRANDITQRLNSRTARLKPKLRKPNNRPQPQPIIPSTTEPAKAPKQIPISDIIIKTDRGELEPTVAAKVRLDLF